MKKLAAILMLGTVLVTPELAFAKDLKVTAQIASYNGPPTYFAIYLVKPDGSYAQTLHVAGGRAKYLRHLRDWVRGISTSNDTIDAITGASVGSASLACRKVVSCSMMRWMVISPTVNFRLMATFSDTL